MNTVTDHMTTNWWPVSDHICIGKVVALLVVNKISLKSVNRLIIGQANKSSCLKPLDLDP